MQNNPLLKHLHICSIGYYPKAKDHYTYRKKGLQENFLFYCVDGHGWFKLGGENDMKYRPMNFLYSRKIRSMLMAVMKIIHGQFTGYTLVAIHFPELNKIQVVQNHFKPHYVKNNGDIVSLFTKIYKTLELGKKSTTCCLQICAFQNFLPSLSIIPGITNLPRMIKLIVLTAPFFSCRNTLMIIFH